MQNLKLKKRYKWTYLHNRNRLTDLENELVSTRRERLGRGIDLGVWDGHVWVCACSVTSFVSDSMTLWTIACQAPLCMRFSRQEYRSALPFPPPGDLPDQRVEPTSLTSPALAGRIFTTSTTWGFMYHTFMLWLLKCVFINLHEKSSLEFYSLNHRHQAGKIIVTQSLRV